MGRTQLWSHLPRFFSSIIALVHLIQDQMFFLFYNNILKIKLDTFLSSPYKDEQYKPKIILLLKKIRTD